MKDFKTFVNESVTGSDAEENGPKVAETIQKEVQKLLPNHVVKATFQKRIGNGIQVALWGENPPNNINRNSPTFMQFMIHLPDGDKEVSKVSMESLSVHHSLKKNGVKFRKINDTSIEGLGKKFVAWVKKNKDKLQEIELENSN